MCVSPVARPVSSILQLVQKGRGPRRRKLVRGLCVQKEGVQKGYELNGGDLAEGLKEKGGE